MPLSESKLRALLGELAAMRAADPSAKALVFSQFASTLAWLKARLAENGFGYRTVDGSMAPDKRAAAIAAFQNDPPTTVFLLSVRAGAVGINLTAANHVFLLEPMLNAALEAQAVGRCWRMGQAREVRVVKLFVKDTVEDRVLELNDQRAAAAAARAHMDALPGAITRDVAKVSEDEFEILFS